MNQLASNADERPTLFSYLREEFQAELSYRYSYETVRKLASYKDDNLKLETN